MATSKAADGSGWALLQPAAIGIFAATSLIKLLCMPFYRSTDFDVHRNWLAITHSLPVKEWYFEASRERDTMEAALIDCEADHLRFLILASQKTSEWTLDYPPFFALFELLLSYPARIFDPQMLVISADPYQSRGTIFYQKLTVILTDMLLYYAISQFVQARGSWYESYTKSQRMLTLVRETSGHSTCSWLGVQNSQAGGFRSLVSSSYACAIRVSSCWIVSNALNARLSATHWTLSFDGRG
jgi:hypothetical protein